MRFVVCGEALIDMLSGDERTPAESAWRALSGGGPMNTAVALGKLGLDSHFLGRLSSDAFGRQLAEHIESNGVQLDLAITTDDPTSLAIVSLDDEGKAHYTFHFHGTSNFNWHDEEFPELSEGDWLHFGSIGAVTDPSYSPVLRFVAGTEAKISFDINVRPTVIPDRAEYNEKVASFLRVVGENGGIAKASDDDLLWLTEGADPVETAQRWCAEFGLPLFIVTLGADGVAAVRGDGSVVKVAGRRVEVADTVGAGDTFMAGFLSSYADNPEALEAALDRGVAAAALVCTRQGAKPPTAEEVDAFLSR
ncbi:carbohydrate kinase family protein [Tessaracoccus caeni]|uniref:carbohydrate kinase family protein n=1 Tax=Tessaracoccus caeni TaxID=3031239 RepID=UPI0023DC09BB|nr:carbohydrate kinase [Tessaracoccus caeni]MDF1489563.1 carbohydrate kinase [Tessaracoccus caeni]